MNETNNLYRKSHSLEIRPLGKEDQDIWDKTENLIRIIQEQKALRAKDKEYHFAAFQNNKVLANIAIKGIRRENLQSAYLDLALEKKEVGDQYLLEIISASCDIAFTEVGLNRLEVLALGQQMQWISVLKKASFRNEGLRKFALYKDKKWQDAYIYAMAKNEYINKNVKQLMKASHQLI